MRKNKMMRLASALLVAVLLTTCAISGTFAKYVTEGSASDSARVAKWGVNVVADGTMFATYEDGSTVAKSVLSADTNNVVAPGMSGELTSVVVTGTPEVAVEITYEATVTVTGWIIDAGSGDEFYCPLVITVDSTEINGLDYDDAADFAADIKAAIDGHSDKYTAGTDLSTVTGTSSDDVAVSWAWAYNGTGDQTDAKDTLVADVTATIEIGIKTTVTQLDT